jgi:hypothetical protein
MAFLPEVEVSDAFPPSVVDTPVFSAPAQGKREDLVPDSRKFKAADAGSLDFPPGIRLEYYGSTLSDCLKAETGSRRRHFLENG